MGKPEKNRPLGRPRRRREDNIKRIIQKSVGQVNWIDLAQDRDTWPAFAKAVMDFPCFTRR